MRKGGLFMYAAIYCRKSVDTQRGASMESQLAHCRSYLAAHRSAETAKTAWVYQDEGFSGAAMARPAMQRLLGDVRSHLISCVVCYRLDRISRSVADFTALMEEFSRCHVDFLCASEEFDTAKPMGRAMLYIASVFSQLERETLAERVRDNMYTLAESGRWLGGPPPYGYRIVRKPPPHPYSVLAPVDEELRIVREMFACYWKYGAIAEVADALAGVRNRQGNAFTPRYIRSILRNPVYTNASADTAAYLSELGYAIGFSEESLSGPKRGMLIFGKHPNHGEAMPLVIRGSHPALIADDEWLEIQQSIRIQKRCHPPTAGILRQFFFCGKCGSMMVSKPRSGRNGAHDYICKGKMRYGSCDCENLNGAEADARAWEAVCDALDCAEKIRTIDRSGRQAVLQLCVARAEWDGQILRLTLHHLS